MVEDFRRDATENMYLGDIKARDIDNLKLIMDHEAKDYYFGKPEVAMEFMGKTVNKALKKLGVDQLELLRANNRHGRRSVEKLIDKRMAECGVKVERRRYEGEHMWRSGIYMYHHNEIAYWISEPVGIKTNKNPDGVIIFNTPVVRWMVKTNYKD